MQLATGREVRDNLLCHPLDCCILLQLTTTFSFFVSFVVVVKIGLIQVSRSAAFYLLTYCANIYIKSDKIDIRPLLREQVTNTSPYLVMCVMNVVFVGVEH